MSKGHLLAVLSASHKSVFSSTREGAAFKARSLLSLSEISLYCAALILLHNSGNVHFS